MVPLFIAPTAPGSETLGAGKHPGQHTHGKIRHEKPGDEQQNREGQRQFNAPGLRSEEHTSELQSLMRISYAVFCLKKKRTHLWRRQMPLTHHHRRLKR